jgi:hypothetical protein
MAAKLRASDVALVMIGLGDGLGPARGVFTPLERLRAALEPLKVETDAAALMIKTIWTREISCEWCQARAVVESCRFAGTTARMIEAGRAPPPRLA